MTVPQPNRLYKCRWCDNVTAGVVPPEICYMCEIIDKVIIKIIHRTPPRKPEFLEIDIITVPARES